MTLPTREDIVRVMYAAHEEQCCTCHDVEDIIANQDLRSEGDEDEYRPLDHEHHMWLGMADAVLALLR